MQSEAAVSEDMQPHATSTVSICCLTTCTQSIPHHQPTTSYPACASSAPQHR